MCIYVVDIFFTKRNNFTSLVLLNVCIAIYRYIYISYIYIMKRSNKLVEYNGIVAYNVFVHLYIYMILLTYIHTHIYLVRSIQQNQFHSCLQNLENGVAYIYICI